MTDVLDARAIALAEKFYQNHPEYIKVVGPVELIKIAKRLDIQVFQSDAMPADVFGRVGIEGAAIKLVLHRQGHLVRKRFLVAKLIARTLLETKSNFGEFRAKDCTLNGPDSLENQLACALMIPESRVRAIYVVAASVEKFAAYFQVNPLCAELVIRTHLGEKSLALMRAGSVLRAATKKRAISTRPTMSSKQSDTDWTSEIVSLGVGAAITSILGF